MHLSRLSLSHFRSHRRTALDLDARPVALSGPNGAGKTNLIEAVSLFSPGRGLRFAAAQDMARRPESLGWKVSGIAHGAGGRVSEVAMTSDAGAPRKIAIDGKAATQTALAGLVRTVWLIPSMDRLWIEGAEGRRRFLDRAALSLFPDHAQAALDYDRAMRERNRLLKDQVRDPAWHSALEAQMARAGSVLHRHRQATLARLARAQAGAQTAFPAATLTLTQPDGALPDTADDLRRALADNRPRDLYAGRALIGPHRSDLLGVYAAKDVPAADCSTGEQKALLISLILANARAIVEDTGSPPLVLLDEVAAHLDPARRAALYDEICALGSQAWMTGTEPSLFADLGARAQSFAVTETDGESRIDAG